MEGKGMKSELHKIYCICKQQILVRSIQQTASGDLLMECLLEADPPPEVKWQHASQPIRESSRVVLTLNKVSGNLYKANLVIKVSREQNANPGGFGNFIKL
jgi:hypothetical protein